MAVRDRLVNVRFVAFSLGSKGEVRKVMSRFAEFRWGSKGLFGFVSVVSGMAVAYGRVKHWW